MMMTLGIGTSFWKHMIAQRMKNDKKWGKVNPEGKKDTTSIKQRPKNRFLTLLAILLSNENKFFNTCFTFSRKISATSSRKPISFFPVKDSSRFPLFLLVILTTLSTKFLRFRVQRMVIRMNRIVDTAKMSKSGAKLMIIASKSLDPNLEKKILTVKTKD